VALRGELPDHDEVRYATDDAWDVDGVRGVRCELRVNTARRKPLDRTGRPATHGDAGGGRS
jgi:osmotically-inducible protein OsmY